MKNGEAKWKDHIIENCIRGFPILLLRSQRGSDQDAYRISVSFTLLLKINWNTWNATKSENDCYVCTSVWFNRRGSTSLTLTTKRPSTALLQFHFESPHSSFLIKLITMGFHILRPHSCALSYDDSTRLYNALFYRFVFIEFLLKWKLMGSRVNDLFYERQLK
jgi:hypothetical protein